MIVFGIAYLVALAAVLGACLQASPDPVKGKGFTLLLALMLVSGIVLSVATL